MVAGIASDAACMFPKSKNVRPSVTEAAKQSAARRPWRRRAARSGAASGSASTAYGAGAGFGCIEPRREITFSLRAVRGVVSAMGDDISHRNERVKGLIAYAPMLGLSTEITPISLLP